MGGFNYVSRELAPNTEDPFSFYLMNSKKLDIVGDDETKASIKSQALHFMHDLAQFKKRSTDRGERHWFIFIIATTKSEVSQVHLWRLASDPKEVLLHRINGLKRDYGSTVMKEDEERLQQMFQDIHDALAKRTVVIRGEEQGIVTQLDNCDLWKGINDSNIMRRMGGGTDSNSLTVRISYEILAYHSNHLLIMKDIADAIKKQVEPNRDLPKEAVRCFQEDGDGFADRYGEERVFLRTPQALNEMIREGNNKALKIFGNSEL